MNWVIGDLHGMLEKFESILAQINDKDKNPTIYCVGDYCDRGPNTKGVVDRILKEGNIQCVKGNHDDIMDCILTGKPTQTTEDQTYEAPLSSLSWFTSFGMYETFSSYGQDREAVRNGLRGLRQCAVLASTVPESHHKFFNELPLMIETPEFFIAHAAIVPELALSEALSTDIYRRAMIWGRFTDAQIQQEKVWGKVGYFGHTPTKHYGSVGKPVIGKDVVLVDTGAVFGSALTAFCHETKEVLQA